MRKSKTELAKEVFARSEKRIKQQKERKMMGLTGCFVIGVLLVLSLGISDAPRIFGPDVISAAIYSLEDEHSFFSNDIDVVEELLDVLASYTEVEVSDESNLQKKASHYFIFKDLQGVEKVYYLYDDGTLICSDGTTYYLDDVQLQELVGYVEENYYQNQNKSIDEYKRLLASFQKKHTNELSGKQAYDENYGGAYIDDNGELVVLLVEINEQSIQEVHEAIGCDKLIIKDCEYSFGEMIGVIEIINEKYNWLADKDVEITLAYEDVYTNRVNIKVRKLTTEKENIIREVVNSSCVVILDGASTVIESPIAEETINGIPDVMLAIVEDSVTSTTLIARFSNTGEREILYGPENYYIESYNQEDGKWYRLACYRSVVTLEARVLKAGQIVEEQYDWKWEYGELSEGYYRLLMEVNYLNEKGGKECKYLAEEFFVQ